MVDGSGLDYRVIVALQRLPARQRAMLILRDVVALSADEAAAALDLSVATANSLLQRARDELATGAHRRPSPVSADMRAKLLARFMAAWESGDPDELVRVLRADAIATMPPLPLWLSGRDAIIDYMIANVFTVPPPRLVVTACNDDAAFAGYLPHGFGWITVVEIAGDGVSAFHSFRSLSPDRYGVASSLPHAGIT